MKSRLVFRLCNVLGPVIQEIIQKRQICNTLLSKLGALAVTGMLSEKHRIISDQRRCLLGQVNDRSVQLRPGTKIC